MTDFDSLLIPKVNYASVWYNKLDRFLRLHLHNHAAFCHMCSMRDIANFEFNQVAAT